MYRTGDYGRCMPDGNIQFLGRIDDEIKVNGVRVNLAEIDAAMSGFPEVSAAVARLEQARLCGYIVPRQERAFDLDSFQRHVARHLPAAAIPSRYAFMPALPVGASGKVDRRADAAYAAARWLSDPPAAGGHPSTETEVHLIDIWKRVLRRSVLRVDEDFHAIGGDSIQAVRIVHALRLRGYALGLEDLLNHPTVKALARFADGQQRQDPLPLLTSGVAPALQANFSSEITDMQRHVLERYRENVAAAGIFHVQFAYRFRDRQLSLEAFERALAKVTERHAVFSSSFRTEPTGWSQQVNATATVPLMMVEWSRGQPPDDLSPIHQYLEADRLDKFDPGQAPLVRFRLAPIDGERVWFVMSAHHAVYDGWSHRIFIGALLSAYVAEKRGQTEPERGRETVFTELPRIQSVAERCSEARALFAPWSCRAAAAAPVERGALQRESPSFEELQQELDRELLLLLLDRARLAKVSPKALFAHAFGLAVRATLDLSSIGVITNGRSAELSDPFAGVGLFWNVLPIACPVGDGSVASLRATQARLNSVDQFGNYPVGAIGGWIDSVDFVFRFLSFPPLEALDAQNELKVEQALVIDRYDFPFVLTASLLGNLVSGTISAQFDTAKVPLAVASRLWQSFVKELEGFARCDCSSRAMSP